MDIKENKYHNIIAKNIKNYRLKAKISQEKMAENLNCSREFISRVENCKERISLNMLLKISELFQVNPSSLFKES